MENNPLLDLAKKRFGNLTYAEAELLKAAFAGTVADARRDKTWDDDPANANTWDDSRAVQAKLLAWLCTDREAVKHVHYKGVHLQAAQIVGKVDLQFATLPRPLILEKCAIKDGLSLSGTETSVLIFSGSHIGSITADGLKTKDAMILNNGFTMRGELCLVGAEIGGSLNCSGGRFENEGNEVLIADGLTTKCGVFLDKGFIASGEVRLPGADIGGDLDCASGKFENKKGAALTADGIKTKGNVFFGEGFLAKGEVRLVGADISGDLICSGGIFENQSGDALIADRLKVKGTVFLDKNFTAKGEIRFLNADIGGPLDCGGGTFENPPKRETLDGKEEVIGGTALKADGMKVKGALFLNDGFTARGEVRLLGADIGGQFACGGGTFENPPKKETLNGKEKIMGGKSLSADGMKVKGALFLNDGFTARGEVRLLGADISGSLSCGGGTFENPRKRETLDGKEEIIGGTALKADGMKVKGSVFLRDDFTARGEVRLPGADIDGQFNCNGGTFDNENGDALNAQHIHVHQIFFWQPKKVEGGVDLMAASVGTLVDDVKNWPTNWPNGKTFLDGFTYERFAGAASVKAKERIEWLCRQPFKKKVYGFRPQPHEQLATVLRNMGHEWEARKVLYEKQEYLRKSGSLRGFAWFWNLFLGITIGHGWKPLWGLVWIALFVSWGMRFFESAHANGVMMPSKERIYTMQAENCDSKKIPFNVKKIPDEYPKFSGLLYSVDAFFPFTNFHVEDYWLPDVNKSGERWYQKGKYYRWYLWIHIAAGWVLSTLAVGALTGLIRKE